MNKLLRYSLMSLLLIICGVAHAEFPLTATWDFTNANVVAAAVVLSGSTETGQIKAIEDNAFSYVGWSGSSSLEKVTLGSGVETIGNWAFDGMKDEALVLPKSMKSVI